MASRRQIIANRRNAQKSTGPRTIAGKHRSRRNAVRHGLTGETVITVYENAKDYEAFEREVVRQYRPQTAIHRQLVLRLCSLLWRLRRATAIETGLFRIQGQIIKERRVERRRRDASETSAKAQLYEMLKLPPDFALTGGEGLDLTLDQPMAAGQPTRPALETASERIWTSNSENELPQIVAQCFMRVARLDGQLLDRLGRYESSLWRQATQVIKILSFGR
jgi:hypothetical protein